MVTINSAMCSSKKTSGEASERLPLQAWRAIHKNWAKWSVCDTEEVFEIDIILVQAELPDMVPWDKLLEEISWDPVLTEMKNAEENVLPL